MTTSKTKTAAKPKTKKAAAKPKTKRVSWSPSQEEQLKALASKKTKAKVIAQRFKRSEGAVRQKAFSMGVSLDAR
jgi:hypothetical protein